MSLVGMVLFGFYIFFSPAYSFHPLCTYSVNAYVTAEVEIDGVAMAATVVHQNSHSRQWISQLNSAGCQQRYGNALVYRLPDDRVLMLSARLFRAAVLSFAKTGHVDIARTCTGRQATQSTGFLIDTANRPERWRTATEGTDFRLVRMTATSTWNAASDDIATTAPNLLRSKFSHVRQGWSHSPEPLINFHRRYDEVRHKPDKSFDFDVQPQAF
jgi:hypothetical protein